MIFREALVADIPQIQIVRHSVKENVLSDPALVTDADCEIYLTQRGKGWVCEINNEIVGFAIADLQENNIWALFIAPQHEGRGIGTHLHKLMMNWYFQQGKKSVWLGTAAQTRAASFYKKAGWTQTCIRANGEPHFEMTAAKWNTLIHK